MKVAESWLREWVDPELDGAALGHQLTMLGHEVDSIDLQGRGLDGVVVAEVVGVAQHPDADRLRVCQVSTGDGEPIEVVCGAPNVTGGMKAVLAVPGVTLPNGVKLRKSRIRGVVSHGMLCSAAELGLGDESDGILSLPSAAPAGTPISQYLVLPDAVFDLDLTPNRGDCFSILGVARDIAALTGAPLTAAGVEPIPASIADTQEVELVEPAGCPVFAGRIVRNIDSSAKTPLWMVERLRRAGLRAIHPVVDVTNYVMTEYGQPLHGYDANRLKGTIRPRFARSGESLTLLDEKTIVLNNDTMVVSDDSGVIGLAGIMGGLSTAVNNDTRDVYLEAAFWPPGHMAGRARAYGLHTDASLRFERGVDPEGQARAIERATELLLDIAGGEPGPTVVNEVSEFLPSHSSVHLREARLNKLLGVAVDPDTVTGLLTRLGFSVEQAASGWDVLPPSHRFDVGGEVDLIEEVARIIGYDSIPERTAIAQTPLRPLSESSIETDVAATILLGRDYQEAITYSFISATDELAISGTASALVLSNPISSEMSVMRSSLWSGLLRAAAGNLARQQDRVRLFEIGKSFHGTLKKPLEVVRIAGLACGPASPEQWGRKSRPVDFFDIKSDIQALLSASGATRDYSFVPAVHPALQPGQTAEIFLGEERIGLLGKLHPKHAKQFDLKQAVYVFELDADRALASKPAVATRVSRFPTIRRDIAVVVAEQISSSDIVRAAAAAAPQLIKAVKIFDIYQGPGIEAGLKSVAISLILQETSRTLTDHDADAAQAATVQKLHQDFAAVLRD